MTWIILALCVAWSSLVVLAACAAASQADATTFIPHEPVLTTKGKSS